MKNKNFRFDTQAIHAGEPRPFIERAIIAPIFQSSTYEYGGEASYNDVRYVRLNNTPNHTTLAEKLAALEGTETGVVTASGMSAISTALLSVISEGGNLLSQDCLYGGTHHFLHEQYSQFGRSASFFPIEDISNLKKYLTPKTQGIYVESVSNPLLKIGDLKAVVAFAKQNGLITLIDNTFPSPYNFNPAHLGFDVVLHSATKYINGHSDVAAGAILTSHELFKKVVPVMNHLGPCLDPHACFLLNRGLKTLGVRMRFQNESAMKLAQALSSVKKVKKVIYPGLESHPDHRLAKELFRGFGGVVCFEYDGTASELDAKLHKMILPASAPSLGGVETLMTRPATTSHSGVPAAKREQLGVSDSLVRVSVGLEDPEDLIEDFLKVL